MMIGQKNRLFTAASVAFFCMFIIVAALLIAPNASANERRAVELTFLKAKPSQRDALKAFIVQNWFEMDRIAQSQGLIESFKITDTGNDEGDWNLLVTVGYYNEQGFEGIKEAFDRIRAAHKTNLIDGKNLRDLGSIVDSKRTFEFLDQSLTKLNSVQINGVQSPISLNRLLERNKTNVLAFYDLMFNQSKPAQAMERYGASTYTQHNPEVPDGKAAFIEYFDKLAQQFPKKTISFKRVFAEGHFVIVHSEHHFAGWRGGNWAAIDIFRLEPDGKIAEHWDVLQKVPAIAANNNGMF
jgi:predicted SnoaL-like aldol condensation-catalyzing enzyme